MQPQQDLNDVQVAYSIMADYAYYPEDVESNQAEIACGF